MKRSSVLLVFMIALNSLPMINSAYGGADFRTGLALLDNEPEKEADLILLSEGQVFRTDSTSLFIVAEIGDTVSFLNPIYVDGYEMICYNRLAGYFPQVDYWVVELTGHEWSSWQLINGRSGIEQSAISFPAISPDGTRFLCSYRDLIAAFNYNGIQIWRIEQDSLVLEYEIVDAMCMWGPSDVHWESDTSVAFNMLEVNWDYWKASTRPGRLELMEDGTWVLNH